MDIIVSLENGTENVVTTDVPPPSDGLLAEYEAPELEGFAEQDKLIKQLKKKQMEQLANGETLTLDPLRGIGMPEIPPIMRED